jgi:hypothetical protein
MMDMPQLLNCRIGIFGKYLSRAVAKRIFNESKGCPATAGINRPALRELTYGAASRAVAAVAFGCGFVV